MKKLLALLLVGTVLMGCNYKYSEGTRTGIVQKISKKGFLCKTYEGELLVAAGNTLAPEKFVFAVQDEVTLKKISYAITSKQDVELTYSQYVLRPPCSPDSPYIITDVTYVNGTAVFGEGTQNSTQANTTDVITN